ncbi:dihydrolipoamide acetyltransferase family protein [Actinophytocola algeriensis]|uniref:Dihydrolipoamide acetyltransferase component of pyruvate dehydrogenase complex n=1 Tax=Actinophytocola algeriensis TaxID=1768010 RepID=A0A7W7VDW5_9PSEU|nr:dihydrolipoamide acetyltransferase family protein [Actinophytocola algeriensis]MBB4906613.1 pyruvate dehydrogenase E2 component (dihydrolipoamide acetyltransferase) [Actinophytocola algeriensis]MBE1478094.1 pyruvate dehydrogenase E2 component (dihydrolipoamide acetyltransferase) [Actinophytocola algeriensis]
MPDFKVFPLPDTAEGLVDAEILTWHIKPGDEVKVNQIIVEIETAKAAVELPCPWAGVVTELHAEPGQTVNVGAPIVTIDVDPGGAAAPAAAAAPAPAAESNGQAMLVGYGPKASTAKRRARKDTAPAPAAPVATAPPPPVAKPVTVPDSPAALLEPSALVPLAKPPVRKLAKDLGVDLRSLAGSGVITREDVERAAHGAVTPVPAPVASGDRERRVPVKGVRKMTAQAMVESAYSAPHVTEFLTVDVTPMMELRARLKTHPSFRDVKITPLTFAAKAVCLAAKRTPDVNATWAGEEIVYKDYVHLGIAAATPRGLVVPKIRDADGMSLRELAEALEQLTVTARNGKTTPADMLHGTITITNVGVFGVDTGTPIINPGESAILALGAIKDMPWVVDGEIKVRKVCQLSLSFDHRVVDGQQGSQFLADVGAIMADPAMAITF